MDLFTLLFVGHLSQSAYNLSIINRGAGYVSRPFPNTHPPISSITIHTTEFPTFLSMLWSKWMVHKNTLLRRGLNPRPLSNNSSVLPLERAPRYASRAWSFFFERSIRFTINRFEDFPTVYLNVGPVFLNISWISCNYVIFCLREIAFS